MGICICWYILWLIFVDEHNAEQATHYTRTVAVTKVCYSVSETSSGQLLVGGNGGFYICNNGGGIVRFVSVSTGHIHSIEFYNNKIYTLCMEGAKGPKRYVIVFNSDD